MDADAYVAKCLGEKLKMELMDLGVVLGVRLRKSWSKEKMVGLLGRRYREKPEILFHVLSKEEGDFLRRCLRNAGKDAGALDSLHNKLQLLGLVEKKKKPPGKKDTSVEREGIPVEDSLGPFLEESDMRRILLRKQQVKLIRRLDRVEKLVRGMLRVFGLLEETELVRMAAASCFEEGVPTGPLGEESPESVEKGIRAFLTSRLGLRTCVMTYKEDGKTYRHHPSVMDPERLRYRIETSPVKSFRAFSCRELVALGDGEETSGMPYRSLLALVATHGRKIEEKKERSDVERDPGRPAVNRGRRKGSRNSHKGNLEKENLEKENLLKEWEEDILHIKLRIREGAPNLEMVREVMEKLSFEDHEEVSRFIERFVSHCDDIPRWNLKGYRMNEI